MFRLLARSLLTSFCCRDMCSSGPNLKAPHHAELLEDEAFTLSVLFAGTFVTCCHVLSGTSGTAIKPRHSSNYGSTFHAGLTLPKCREVI